MGGGGGGFGFGGAEAEEIEHFGIAGLDAHGVVGADGVAFGVVDDLAVIAAGDGFAGDGAAVSEREGSEMDLDTVGADASLTLVERQCGNEVGEDGEEGEEEADAGAEGFGVEDGAESGPAEGEIDQAEYGGETGGDPAAAEEESIDHEGNRTPSSVYFPLWY